jgi:hypothetical protein
VSATQAGIGELVGSESFPERKCVHHKRKCSKNGRAGCLLCKPNKMNGWAKHRVLGHVGFGKLRREIVAQEALKELEE